jgi:hypothetical protein
MTIKILLEIRKYLIIKKLQGEKGNWIQDQKDSRW